MLHLMDVESSHLQYQCGQPKPIVAVKRHHEFYPRTTPQFIVIYKTDGGFAGIVAYHLFYDFILYQIFRLHLCCELVMESVKKICVFFLEIKNKYTKYILSLFNFIDKIII